MCQFKSALVLQDKIYCPLDEDSHEKMIHALGLRDDQQFRAPAFVRVEMTPNDDDIFNHDLANWTLRVDQDNAPEWFDKKEVWEKCKPYLKDVFDQRFIINDKTWQRRVGQRLFIKNSNVKTFNSSVVAWGNSSVVAWENSSVVARENSSVEAWENSSVEARENSSVVIPYSTSIKIKDIQDNATVKDLSGGKLIIYVANKDIELKQFKKL